MSPLPDEACELVRLTSVPAAPAHQPGTAKKDAPAPNKKGSPGSSALAYLPEYLGFSFEFFTADLKNHHHGGPGRHDARTDAGRPRQ